jgi:hypothetical protein
MFQDIRPYHLPGDGRKLVWIFRHGIRETKRIEEMKYTF